MDLIRKYYAPDPPTGGGGYGGDYEGPSEEDVRRTERLNDQFATMRNNIRGIGAALKEEVSKQLVGLTGTVKDVGESLAKDLQREIIQSKKFTDELSTATGSITKKLTTSAKVQAEIAKVEARKNALADIYNELEKEGFEITKKMQDEHTAITEELNRQIGILDQQLELRKKQEESLEVFGKVMEGITKIPLVGSLINAQKVMEKVKKVAEEGGSKWKQLGVGIQQTFLSMGAALANPSFLITSIVGLFQKLFMMAINVNKKFFETAKTLGTSVTHARGLYTTFQNMAPLGLKTKEVAESYAQISDSLGFMAPATADFAGNMALIQKRTGASADQLNALATAAAYSGKSVKATYVAMTGTAAAAGAQNKLMLSTRQVMDKISKVSSAVLINFKGSTSALTAAVVRATKLGTSLEQVNKQAESLLDFETSIQNQFEAEALTGQQLNLDRARALALAGDTKGVMEELNAQGMNMQKFESMNVIQREAFAKAIGLSNEELSKQLLMQKQAEALGAQQGQSLKARYQQLKENGASHEEIVRLIGEEEAAELRKQSLADKWDDLLEKIQDRLGAILEGPVSGIVNKIIAFLNDTQAINAVGEKIKKVFSFIEGILTNLPSIMRGAIEAAKILASLSIARAVATVVMSAASVPGVGWAVGAAAGVAAYAYLSSLTNGLVSGGGGGGGAMNTASEIRPMNQSAQMAAENNRRSEQATNVNVKTQLVADNKVLAETTHRGSYKSGYGQSTDGNTNIMAGVGATTGQ